MSSSAMKKMSPPPPKGTPVPATYQVAMSDNGFSITDLNVRSGDQLNVVGTTSMTKTLNVKVDKPTQLRVLSANPFSVAKATTMGPFTISGNVGDTIHLTTSTGGGGGGDI